MIAVLESYRLQIARAWHRSGVGEFLAWWYHELVSVLPESIRSIVDHPKERLLITVDDQQLQFERMLGDNRETLLVQSLAGDPEVDGSQARALFESFDEEQPATVFAVDPDQLLRKKVSFPAAAVDNLRQVIGFEMDRHTPFKAADVFYDCRIIEPSSGAAQVMVELVLVPKFKVERTLKAIAARGLSIDRIDFVDAGALAGVNLLSPADRPRRVNRRMRLNIALGIITVALIYGVMWQSIASREQAIAEYQSRIDGVRGEAMQVAELKNRLTEAREAANFLRQKRSASVAVIEVLNEVTRILPDSAYLQRLQLRENELQLTGQAPESSELIRLLEASPMLATPSPRGSIPRDPQTGKERFTIEAMVRSKEGDDGSAASNG